MLLFLVFDSVTLQHISVLDSRKITDLWQHLKKLNLIHWNKSIFIRKEINQKQQTQDYVPSRWSHGKQVSNDSNWLRNAKYIYFFPTKNPNIVMLCQM